MESNALALGKMESNVLALGKMESKPSDLGIWSPNLQIWKFGVQRFSFGYFWSPTLQLWRKFRSGLQISKAKALDSKFPKLKRWTPFFQI